MRLQVSASGRSSLAAATKPQAHREWANFRQSGDKLISGGLADKRYCYDVATLTKLPTSYTDDINNVGVSKAFGSAPLLTHYVEPFSVIQFATKYVLSYRFFFIYMARTTFQAVRPLLAFCVFGEIMKLVLANVSGGLPAFLFSFVLAFEVLYFFLQCYISYTFLTMFFTCKVEEDIYHIEGFRVRTGVMGKLKLCEDAVLTSSNLSYSCGGSTNQILLSNITQCELKRHRLQRAIKITCTDSIFFLTCDDVSSLHQELTKALIFHDNSNVIRRSGGLGGVSRVVSMKNEMVEDANSLRINAMTDLAMLKKKSQKIRSMAHHLQTGHRSLSKTFEALNLRIFEDSPRLAGSDVEEIILRVMKNGDFILLQDLFCVVNRMRLCKLLTPAEVRSHVERIQEEGKCKMVDIHGVEIIFTDKSARFLKAIAQTVAEAPTTPYQFAEAQKITLIQAEYQLLYAEMKGVVTRDDETYRIRYYHNPFSQQAHVT
ncbi:hypothetical protein, conserved [Babesia bigemina]|uniref:Vacuolar protein-sorting-associated protein 36 n=1 Tax=Babesia bigemina TaxID=5866 RepID=A0A061D2B5_BABBI|nr:hypothetical protein, conserved [Babesia bigemina]CDR94242.1 hypothetical protein, conserved [Babesia bigemina]|eukprot:XP_012766428.1 hypothetical protein, conserved [Babesia bigemina]